ncbi:hypothetical protein Syun_026045 [Stephania yunnanensis]|uniref:Uncharacterized protein n=1 Tax=Stephania yunnanensis TaxID=152371 RepID=A0AAP0HWP0_9MAGN
MRFWLWKNRWVFEEGFNFGQSRLSGFLGFYVHLPLHFVPRSHSRARLVLSVVLWTTHARSGVNVKMNSKLTRLDLPLMPARGAHQAASAASGRSLVAWKVEEMKKVKEVLLLKSSSSSLLSSTTTTTTAYGLGGYAEDVYRKVEFLKSQKRVVKLKANLQSRRQELTQTTLDQPVDDKAVYYKVAGKCPKGRVYGLGSLGRKKRRYAYPGASTTRDEQLYCT